ncbi:Hpt domain-containing protein [Lachnospiraceae bacterium C1.1]|nr:Hpt domain-containing protein [Lachnospiraceae bacterium C1.1]
MTVEEFYNNTGGDYEEIIKRLKAPEKVVRFVNMFMKDGNYNDLKAAIEEKNAEAAFKAAHNLKGVSANLSFKKLTAAASDITEALRNGELEKAIEIMPRVSECYELIAALVGEL